MYFRLVEKVQKEILNFKPKLNLTRKGLFFWSIRIAFKLNGFDLIFQHVHGIESNKKSRETLSGEFLSLLSVPNKKRFLKNLIELSSQKWRTKV